MNMKRYDINDLKGSDSARKVEVLEWMIAQLLSDKPQLSEESLDEVRTYLAEDGDKDIKRDMEMVFLAAFQRGRHEPSAEITPLIEQEWPKIARALDMNPDLSFYREVGNGGAPEEQRKRTFGKRLFVGVAAVLLPAAMMLGGYYLWDSAHTRLDKVAVPAPFVATTTVEPQSDSIRHITLPDGTEVILNRNSTFSYNRNREGELKGEAYFSVAKQPDHPFVIHSDQLTVTVLGTKFNFRAGAEDGSYKLSLYEGRVRLNHSGRTDNLESGGHEFTFDHATGRVDIRDFDIEIEPDWITQEEVMQRQLMNIIPLGDIFDLIEVKYGVTIVGREAVDLTREYNYIYDESVTIDDVMRAVRFAGGGFDYTISGNTINLETKS
jgi:ferric-dicitrate binding protein FerR (iron transport regulator)